MTHNDMYQSSRKSPHMLQMWKGLSQCILDDAGGITGEQLTGFFYGGNRFLSRLQLLIHDSEPRVCSHARIENDSYELYYIYPPVSTGATGGSGSGMMHKRNGISERGVSLAAVYRIRPAGLDVSIKITNHWDQTADLPLSFLLDADFVSIEDLLSGGKNQHPKHLESHTESNSLIYRYVHENVTLATEIEFFGEHERHIESGRISTRLVLRRREETRIGLHIRPKDCALSVDEQKQREREVLLATWQQERMTLEDNLGDSFIRICNDSIAMVGSAASLHGHPDEWLAPVAGFPLYPYLFGRDALTASWMIALWDSARMLDHVLTKLGRLQGSKEESFRDEQPGRIVQQVRMDSKSGAGKAPFSRYYGDYASPLMYVISCAYLYSCTGDISTIRKHWSACRKAMDWAERYGDIDGDGYLEYKTQSPMGPRNQGWKDSENAVVDEEGRLVDPPIAPCEIQGYYFAALQSAAFFSMLLGERKQALRYYKKSRALKKAFNRDFWVENGGYIGFGLDAQKRLLHVKTSNMGHCLTTGIIDKNKIPSVVEALLSPDMFTGWGIRTLSSTHPAYNPLSYHLGSVWPVENATISLGLRRYGFRDEALRLVKANYDLAKLWYQHAVPECIGGFNRCENSHPGAFPRANAPQTWNAAAWGVFIQVILGLQPLAPLKTLFVDPVLSEWLPDFTLKNLKIGGARVSMHFYRSRSGKTTFKVVEKKGCLHILRQPAVNSLSDSWWGRLRCLFAYQ